MVFVVQLLIKLLVAAATTVSAMDYIGKPDCQDSCGSLSIPYPFGTVKGCYRDDTFLITCDSTTNTSYLLRGNLQVLSISLDGQIRISSKAAVECYDRQGNWTHRSFPWMRVGKVYSLSYSLNKFVAYGCDTIAKIEGFTGPSGDRYFTGCMSYCYSNDSIVNGSCSGVGCCQGSIPEGALGYNISLTSYYRHYYSIQYNPCSYAFVVEDGFYNFSSLDLAYDPLKTRNPSQTIRSFPVVLDWSIGNITCAEAKRNQTTYACKDENSECFDSDKQLGYLCNCSVGFHGNPYLANGCQDDDECANPSLNDCESTSTCQNTRGNYTCICPKGFQGDGRKNGQRCVAKFRQSLQSEIIVGVKTE